MEIPKCVLGPFIIEKGIESNPHSFSQKQNHEVVLSFNLITCIVEKKV